MARGRILALATVALTAGACALLLVLMEGAVALWRFEGSVTSAALELLGSGGEEDADAWPRPIIADARVLEELLPALIEDGVGLGSVPYDETDTERTRLNTERNGCELQRPDLDKTMSYLRAGLWDPFRPVTFFHDTDATLSPEVRDFLDRYARRPIRMRTNEWGERLTFPEVEADDVVVVAGDSVAHGSFVNDDETLASRLQAGDRERRYVNLGVGGADGPDIACALEEAAERYRGRIRGLVYVFCENDFEPGKPLGDPAEVVANLEEFAAREGIEDVTVVFAPYVYNVLPHLTRFRGYRGGEFPTNPEARARLEASVRAAGFRWANMGDLALREADAASNEYAAFALFTDHTHWSPLGTTRMADHLLGTGARSRPQ